PVGLTEDLCFCSVLPVLFVRCPTLRFRRGEQPQRRRSGGCSPSLASGGSAVGTRRLRVGRSLSGPPACPCALLLDHLIRQDEERRGDGEAERLGGLEVDDQLEFRRPLDRQIPRLLTTKYPINIFCCLSVLISHDSEVG